jgi:hypothetical protein
VTSLPEKRFNPIARLPDVQDAVEVTASALEFDDFHRP